jgi:hypothetical protein
MVERVYEEEEEWTMKEDGKFVFITFVTRDLHHLGAGDHTH